MANDALERKLQKANQKITILENLIENSTRDLYLTQENLKTAHARIDSILKAMANALIILDQTGHITMSNPAAISLWGYSEEELKTKSIESIIPDNWFKFQDRLLKSESETQEIRTLCKKGESIPVLLSGSLIRDEHGNITSVVLLAKDLRDYRKIQNQLLHSNKMTTMSQIFGYVAHEINTPMSSITMNCDLLSEILKKKPVDDEAALFCISNMDSVFKRVSSTINELMSFIQESGNDSFQRKHIYAVVQSAIAFCCERLARHKVEIKIDIDESAQDLILECRPAQIAQVLLNLFNNSIDAIDPLKEKWILISARSLEEKIELTVTDSGRGIPNLIRNKIFEPFFTTKESSKGTGFGLNACQKILESHHGHIRLKPDDPHTVFVIEIPKKQIS